MSGMWNQFDVGLLAFIAITLNLPRGETESSFEIVNKP